MIEFSSMFGILGLLIIVPLIIILIVYFLFINKEKKKDMNSYRFKRDFWGNVIAVIYSSLIFSLSLGYAVNVILKIYEYSLQDKYLWLIIGIVILVLLTFLFFMYVFKRYIKVINNKDSYFIEGENNNA